MKHVFSSKITPSVKLRRLLPLAALLTLVAAPPAFAQQEKPNELQKVFGALGLLELPKAPIDYEERAPLVVPPSSDLPTPGNPADVSRLNPEWPVDEDIKRAKSENRGPKFIDVTSDAFYGGYRMRTDQVDRSKKGTAARDAADKEQMARNEAEVTNQSRLSASQLGFKGWGQKQSSVVFNGEPARTSLLEPPTGYRTPSPNAPYGIVEEEQKTLFGQNHRYDRNDERNQR